MNSNDIFDALNESYDESLFSMDDTDSDPNFNPVGISNSESDSDIDPEGISEGDLNVDIPTQTSTNILPDLKNLTWGPADNDLHDFTFNPDGLDIGINDDILFISLIVTETNRYANKKLASPNIKRHSRLQKWIDTNESEIKNFLGIIMYMGTVNMPTIASYWTSSHLLTSHLSHIMSRNRFELLLSHIHFQNNDVANLNNRLYKIQNILDLLNQKFKQWVIPSHGMCIDESMIAFQGRLVFKQYIQTKRHRYGVKVFKLCVSPCYTLKFKIYSGKESEVDKNDSVSSRIVMNLVDEYLDFGRTLYVDNWYTSVSLAHQLLERKTHLVGTLRSNRKYNPDYVVKKKLKKGQVIAQKSSSKVMVLKFKDKRDLHMLSTKHTDNMVMVPRRENKSKPEVVLDYNRGKSFIDLSDQMASYCSPLRKSLKWYRKVVFELLLNTSVVYALCLFQKTTATRIKITDFRSNLIKYLTFKPNMNQELSNKHVLTTASRNRCVQFYLNIAQEK
ncbi:piggyBac transposable element-derived protein 1-like [Aphis gossypii]|uniref:piggyBac transposable element-derived protein 1-like n=1 Tax=Aphis gossypii TaxID=80765 RepID=UPI002159A1A1|nr:piggyBac transposable element-derived protein 1-like [Aphis gossypii]